MNPNSPNLLFYSKKCKTCGIFINTCHNNNVLKFFKLICIDDNIESFSSKGLKVVPTLIIQGHSKSIEGKNVFLWLEQLLNQVKNKNNFIQNDELPYDNKSQISNSNILKRNKEELFNVPVINKNINQNNQNNENNKNNQNNHNNQQISTTGPQVKKSPFGYLKDEMDGFSDSFAYLLSDNPLPKSFTSIDKEQAIYTAPEGDKIDKRTQDLLIKSLENNRANDKVEIEKFYQSEHIKIINDISKKTR
jgi:hypothetical protein